MTLSQFIDKWNNKPADLFSSAKSRKMNTNMPSSISKHKVFHPIIEMIPIYMMNYVFRSKFPSKKFLIYSSISFSFPMWMSFIYHMFLLTLRRTIDILSLFMTFIINKILRTIITLKMSFSRFIITNSITKACFLTRRSLKLVRAKLTNIYNINIIAHNVFNLI